MVEPVAYFQWQNDVLLKTIYPLREMKLRDFLVYYKEIDLWAEYKNKNVAMMQAEYTAAQEKLIRAAYDIYRSRRAYFLKPDARPDYLKYKPLNEAELARINQLHEVFTGSFKYTDVRKEKYFVSERIYDWELHRNENQRLVASKQRRINSMKEQVPPHPNVPKEEQELQALQTALAMSQDELERLYGFLASFDKIEKRKLELFKSKEEAQRGKAQLAPRLTDINDQIAQAQRRATDPQKLASLKTDAEKLQSQVQALDATLNTAEEAYLLKYVPAGPLTAREVVAWKLEEYKAQLKDKNHLQLLEEVVKRFVAQPARYPLWLQYMVIHFSGMRYASAHGSWADPKQLLVGLKTSQLSDDFKKMDEGSVAALAQKTLAVYEGPAAVGSAARPKLAGATDPDWKQKLGYHLRGLHSASPSVQANALLNLRIDEENYEIESMTPAAALEALKAYQDTLPAWMWKEITALTELRVNETKDPNWEKLTDEEQQASYARDDYKYRQILNQWKLADITGWREEHDKTSQLIVTRAVCNEVAEHIQHLRGYSPPGGLTPKAGWYQKHESENKLPGNPRPYFKKPTSQADYTVGASILWLRFWEKEPSPWQVAHAITTKGGDGLLPAEFLRKKAGPEAVGTWNYQLGDPITRTRLFLNEKNQKVKNMQWLRWIHEATVAEVAETADGPVVLTFETALPYEDRRLSSVGIFKHSLQEMLFDGGEDGYNRSFVGFIPEGQPPAPDLEGMLDWNKILRRPFMAPAALEEYRKKYIRRM